MTPRVLVYGPAYLDRVLRVHGPLLDPALGGPLDRSVEGRLDYRGGARLLLLDPLNSVLDIELPPDWPGPSGLLRLSAPLAPSCLGHRQIQSRQWLDDLGGMGAGYASALLGTLVSALGPPDDPMTIAISQLLQNAEIPHQSVPIPHHAADWTLLVTSGPHGDKLPIGFRGCHAALTQLPSPADLDIAPDLIVAAGLPNALVEPLLRAAEPSVKLWAPSLRCLLDPAFPASRLAGAVDVLACNRQEWESLADPDDLIDSLSLRAVTDGPRGASVTFRNPQGHLDQISVPAFPRDRPPVDTNRAGEAFASTLISSLLAAGWKPGPTDPDLVRSASVRASAASALEIDLERFGFPTPQQIDAAVAAGRVR